MGMPVILVDQYGMATQASSVQMASNMTLAATTGSATNVGIVSAGYIFSAIFTGAASVALQALGPDAVTWTTVATLTGSGNNVGVALGSNAAVRLYNPNATSLTSLYASLT